MTISNRPLIQSLIFLTIVLTQVDLTADSFDRSKPVFIEPSEVTFKAKWADRYNQARRSLAEKLTDDDLKELKARTAKSIYKGIKRVLKDADFNLVDDKSGASYILKAQITELEINAPDVSGGPHKVMQVHSAGEASIHLRLATADGQVLAEMTDHQKALEYTDLRRANRVFNDTEFRRMAERWTKSFIKLLK